jgi:hypothetical protein
VATVTPSYSAEATITIALENVATSSTFVAGVEAAVIDNTSNKYDDAILFGKVRVGTTPTINTQILLYVFAAPGDSATYPDVMDGTSSAETLTSVGVGRGFLKLAATLDVDSTTTDRDYPFYVGSVAELFGGIMPPRWSLFMTHNTGVNTNTTGGNHFAKYQGIKFDVA